MISIKIEQPDRLRIADVDDPEWCDRADGTAWRDFAAGFGGIGRNADQQFDRANEVADVGEIPLPVSVVGRGVASSGDVVIIRHPVVAVDDIVFVEQQVG